MTSSYIGRRSLRSRRKEEAMLGEPTIGPSTASDHVQVQEAGASLKTKLSRFQTERETPNLKIEETLPAVESPPVQKDAQSVEKFRADSATVDDLPGLPLVALHANTDVPSLDATDGKEEGLAGDDGDREVKIEDDATMQQSMTGVLYERAGPSSMATMAPLGFSSNALMPTFSGPSMTGGFLFGQAPINTVHPSRLMQNSDLAVEAGDMGPSAEERPALRSFGTLEFADGHFEMSTYSLIIGRDQRALLQARKEQKLGEQFAKDRANSISQGLIHNVEPPGRPAKFSRSYVSEEGGILGPESDGSGEQRPAKRRKTSTAGSAGGRGGDAVTAGESTLFTGSVTDAVAAGLIEADEVPELRVDISDRQYVSHTPGAAPLELSNLMPNPLHIPFIGIHSPGPNIAAKTKTISRRHLKLDYDPGQRYFHATALHKNGFFLNDELQHYGQPVLLRNGDRLQIKDVQFVLRIKGASLGALRHESPSKQHGLGGKEMSFDFESGPQLQDSSDELSEAQDVEMDSADDDNADAEEDDELEDDEMEDDDDDGEGEEEEDDGGDDEELEESVEEPEELTGEVNPEAARLLNLPEDMPLPPRKRGPGRPPKNGIMSQREQRELQKKARELEKAKKDKLPAEEPPVKRKVGRPRKHPRLEDEPEGKREKRKYAPRKPKNLEGADGVGEGPGDAAARKEKKRPRSRSPELILRREDCTVEQLTRPQQNYATLLDEVLSAEPEGLRLKQVYKKLCMRYPWFYFVENSKGWESSVRHNLLGQGIFHKDVETNKWFRVEGATLDNSRKRKSRSESPQGPEYVGVPTGLQPGPQPDGVPQGLAPTSAAGMAVQQHLQGQQAMFQGGLHSLASYANRAAAAAPSQGVVGLQQAARQQQVMGAYGSNTNSNALNAAVAVNGIPPVVNTPAANAAMLARQVPGVGGGVLHNGAAAAQQALLRAGHGQAVMQRQGQQLGMLQQQHHQPHQQQHRVPAPPPQRPLLDDTFRQQALSWHTAVSAATARCTGLTEQTAQAFVWRAMCVALGLLKPRPETAPPAKKQGLGQGDEQGVGDAMELDKEDVSPTEEESGDSATPNPQSTKAEEANPLPALEAKLTAGFRALVDGSRAASKLDPRLLARLVTFRDRAATSLTKTIAAWAKTEQVAPAAQDSKEPEAAAGEAARKPELDDKEATGFADNANPAAGVVVDAALNQLLWGDASRPVSPSPSPDNGGGGAATEWIARLVRELANTCLRHSRDMLVQRATAAAAARQQHARQQHQQQQHLLHRQPQQLPAYSTPAAAAAALAQSKAANMQAVQHLHRQQQQQQQGFGQAHKQMPPTTATTPTALSRAAMGLASLAVVATTESGPATTTTTAVAATSGANVKAATPAAATSTPPDAHPAS